MEGDQHPAPIDASRRVPPSAPPWDTPAGDDDAPDAPDAPDGVASDAAPSRDSFAERPELYVGAAFAGGILLAGLLRVVSR